MKNSLALIAVLLFALTSARAQSAPANPSGGPLHRAPGTAAPAAAASPAEAPKAPEKAPVTIPPDEEKAIHRLMDLLGSSKIPENLDQTLNYQLRTAMSRTMPDDRLKQFMQDFGQNYAGQSPDSKVTQAMVQVYASRLSAQDINGLVQFYESPLGNRFITALPDIIQNSQQEGGKIVREQAISVLRQMTDQYPEIKQILPPESSGPANAPPPVRPVPDQAPPHLESSPQN
ncbi:MAG TPA: DUF2059 domain-containing protein [Verrucomicrobiae bacterium]|nr:DUF2059 domain-containing protein [Verrucomicrobiae bacterium]